MPQQKPAQVQNDVCSVVSLPRENKEYIEYIDCSSFGHLAISDFVQLAEFAGLGRTGKNGQYDLRILIIVKTSV